MVRHQAHGSAGLGMVVRGGGAMGSRVEGYADEGLLMGESHLLVMVRWSNGQGLESARGMSADGRVIPSSASLVRPTRLPIHRPALVSSCSEIPALAVCRRRDEVRRVGATEWRERLGGRSGCSSDMPPARRAGH